MFSFLLAPGSAPQKVAFKHRTYRKLEISWDIPLHLLNGKLTGYKVCYSAEANSSNQKCFEKKKKLTIFSTKIRDLCPATKYFVTIAAGTSAGYGPKSSEIDKITNGGKTDWI